MNDFHTLLIDCAPLAATVAATVATVRKIFPAIDGQRRVVIALLVVCALIVFCGQSTWNLPAVLVMLEKIVIVALQAYGGVNLLDRVVTKVKPVATTFTE